MNKHIKTERNKYKKQYRKNRLDRKKYKQALENILKIICKFGEKDIITFPDFSPKQNYEFIMKQFNAPLKDILKELEVLIGPEKQKEEVVSKNNNKISQCMGTCWHWEQVFYQDDPKAENEKCYQYCNEKHHEIKEKVERRNN